MTAAAAPWVSADGVAFPDRVPAALRRDWVRAGRCPDVDLYRLFVAHARAHPRRPAVLDDDGTLTYAGLDAAVARAAVALAAAGLGPGDVVALRLPNDRGAVLAELAVAALGAVALPYPPERGDADTVALLGRSRAAGAVVDAPLPDHVRTALPHLRAVFTAASLRAAADAVVATGWTAPEIDPEAPARILVSSGSEAEPKMVAYSHNAMAGGRATWVRALHRGDGPMRTLVLVPLGSSMGSCGTSVTVAALGATLVLTGGTGPGRVLRVITRHRPTHVFAVPTTLRRMADAPPEPGEDTSGLHALVASGAALTDTTARACRRRFGRPVITVYGSADGVNCHTARDPAGAGRPDPAVADIAIRDGSGTWLPPGSAGEICALGPMTPLCYVGAPELDARYRTPDGWVRTGDLGTLDERGRLHVLGRLKQVVVRGGCTISPAEVERELGAHPAIADVVCVPVPDPDLGERLCACVRPADAAAAVSLPEITLSEITEFLRRERGLDRQKLPEALVLVRDLPLGPTGKPCRRTLAALAADRLGPHPGGGE